MKQFSDDNCKNIYDFSPAKGNVLIITKWGLSTYVYDIKTECWHLSRFNFISALVEIERQARDLVLPTKYVSHAKFRN